MCRLRYFASDDPILAGIIYDQTDRTYRIDYISYCRRLWLACVGGNEDDLELILGRTANETVNRLAKARGDSWDKTNRQLKRLRSRLKSIVGAAAAAIHHYRSHGDFTFDVPARRAVVIPPGKAVVSLKGFERQIEIRSERLHEEVTLFIAELWDHLHREHEGHRVYLGGFTHGGCLVLDLSIIVPRSEALRWAVRENQKFFYMDGENHRNPHFRRDDDLRRVA